MSKSPTITDELWSSDPADWLHNPHVGEILKSEFLDPLDLAPGELAEALGVDTNRLEAVMEGRARMEADLDLRLGRYYGMSEGFFLRLQNAYELLEARRAHSAELDRIVRRAA